MSQENTLPMASMQGHSMRYNPAPGLRGAEVVLPDGRLLSFGGHEGIDVYADENKLSKTERDGLHAFEQRGRDESRVEALEAGRAQVASLPKDSLPVRGAADLVRADVRMLNEIEDPVQRDHAAAAMAGIAALQRSYKEALIENHRPEAWEVGVHARFLVQLERPRQSAELMHFTDSPQDAMQRYALESQADFMRSQPPGVSVSLTDAQLKLDASRTSEGRGVFINRYGKEEGREAHEAALHDGRQMRAKAFESLPEHSAIAKYPELKGAYGELAQQTRDLQSRELPPVETAHAVIEARASIQGRLEAGRVPAPPIPRANAAGTERTR